VERIEPMTPVGVFQYKLPPSKSHMIRQLTLASKSLEITEIKFEGVPGEDIISMGNCLEKMGVKIEKLTERWIVTPPKNRLIAPKETIFCGNSGTVARIMMSMVANFDSEVTIDGDLSLQKRNNSTLASCLRELGCKVSSNGFPCTVKGPIKPKDIEIDASESSQPISALILSSSDFDGTMKLTIKGKEISRGYLQLTTKLAKRWGLKDDFENNSILLSSWKVVTPKIVKIPSEMSLYPMAILLDNLHGNLQVEIEEQDIDELLMRTLEVLENPDINRINLRDASDIITPAAALMAISDGGEIFGAAHTKGKESDRIKRTSELLNLFSLNCEVKEDGLLLLGGEIPVKPDSPINTYMDHRLAMTAVILGTYCGAEIINPDIIKVTHPDFMKMIKALKLLQP
jgi:3-phosphoshikimate 1-carboxyvinyltransferase